MGDAAGLKLLFLLAALAVVGLRLFVRYGGSASREQPMPDPDDPRWEHNRGREPLAPPKKKKKKKKPRAPESSDAASLEALTLAMQNDKPPRPRHYAFAHLNLRMLLRSKSSVWPLFRDAPSEAALDELLAKAWGDAEGASGASDVAGLRDEIPTGKRIDGGILVRMPPPEGTTEAHFIPAVQHGGAVRYFTLERSLLGAVLCEWTDEVHANMGSCPADEESFLAAVRGRLEPAN